MEVDGDGEPQVVGSGPVNDSDIVVGAEVNPGRARETQGPEEVAGQGRGADSLSEGLHVRRGNEENRSYEPTALNATIDELTEMVRRKIKEEEGLGKTKKEECASTWQAWCTPIPKDQSIWGQVQQAGCENPQAIRLAMARPGGEVDYMEINAGAPLRALELQLSAKPFTTYWVEVYRSGVPDGSPSEGESEKPKGG